MRGSSDVARAVRNFDISPLKNSPHPVTSVRFFPIAKLHILLLRMARCNGQYSKFPCVSNAETSASNVKKYSEHEGVPDYLPGLVSFVSSTKAEKQQVRQLLANQMSHRLYEQVELRDLGVSQLRGRGKREISEKIRRPTASSDTIPTCENLVMSPGFDPGSPWRILSSARPPSQLLRMPKICTRHKLPSMYGIFTIMYVNFTPECGNFTSPCTIRGRVTKSDREPLAGIELAHVSTSRCRGKSRARAMPAVKYEGPAAANHHYRYYLCQSYSPKSGGLAGEKGEVVCIRAGSGARRGFECRLRHRPVLGQQLCCSQPSQLPPAASSPVNERARPPCSRGATVAEWLERLPPTKATRVHSPAGSQDFRIRQSDYSPPTKPNWVRFRVGIARIFTCGRRGHLPMGFLGGTPQFPFPLHAAAAPSSSPHFTLTGAQDRPRRQEPTNFTSETNSGMREPEDFRLLGAVLHFRLAEIMEALPGALDKHLIATSSRLLVCALKPRTVATAAVLQTFSHGLAPWSTRSSKSATVNPCRLPFYSRIEPSASRSGKRVVCEMFRSPSYHKQLSPSSPRYYATVTGGETIGRGSDLPAHCKGHGDFFGAGSRPMACDRARRLDVPIVGGRYNTPPATAALRVAKPNTLQTNTGQCYINIISEYGTTSHPSLPTLLGACFSVRQLKYMQVGAVTFSKVDFKSAHFIVNSLYHWNVLLNRGAAVCWLEVITLLDFLANIFHLSGITCLHEGLPVVRHAQREMLKAMAFLNCCGLRTV
ncbi:hypothetical protein PR048_019885 [Dryococelus australis]|uniref:Uncharacterized protein n=1 Tax=Dryococelus australis TaxID=614101 RepID=A0ABQ9H529_9NEOP|nr:hypothetical protein PR048_019885 [Dryococelus australis]